jgi:Zinc-finger double-stranded RNA-binding
MGRRKRHDHAAEAAKNETQPFCYYCDREFDDEAVLIQHQKSKHFKCTSCGKKMTTIGSLITHHRHVHKETINKVPNAKSERDSLDVQVYGMEGMPAEVLALHRSSKRQKRAGEYGEGDDEGSSGTGGSFIGAVTFVPAVPAPIPLAAAQLSPEMLAILAQAMAAGSAAATAAPQKPPEASVAASLPAAAGAGAAAPPAPAAATSVLLSEKEAAAQAQQAMGGTLVYDDEGLSLEESRVMRGARYLQYLHYL